MRRVVLTTAAGAAIVVSATASYGAAWVHVPQSMTARRVSASEVSNAMAADRFYSDYRLNTLVITAPVTHAVPDQHEIALGASPSGTVSCRLDPHTPMPSVGSSVTIVTVAASAIRRPDGVLLVDCLSV